MRACVCVCVCERVCVHLCVLSKGLGRARSSSLTVCSSLKALTILP